MSAGVTSSVSSRDDSVSRRHPIEDTVQLEAWNMEVIEIGQIQMEVLH